MPRFTLYHTAACHLCEDAHKQILAAFAACRWPVADLALQDIADHADLIDRYGVLIPVLHDAHAASELRWPFSQAAVQALIHAAAPP